MDAKRAGEVRTLNLSADGSRNHPVLGHRVLGTATQKELDDSKTTPTFTGELTCLSCHDPHKGKSPKLLARGAASATESCIFCHKK
jgi:predicted CXXCH cytochrome family protein